jgi:hypothetical protein
MKVSTQSRTVAKTQSNPVRARFFHASFPDSRMTHHAGFGRFFFAPFFLLRVPLKGTRGAGIEKKVLKGRY